MALCNTQLFKRFFYSICALVFTIQVLPSCSKDDSDLNGVQIIPKQTTSYVISISGTTYVGNTNIPTASTTYSPAQNFQLNGTLVVSNGITGHSRDIAILVGRPASNPVAGSIWFASNTQMFITAGVGGGFTQSAQLNIGNVEVNEGNGTFTLQLTDANVGRTAQLNNFNVNSGLVANVFQILVGDVQLNFDKQGAVTGSFEFIGSGYIYPGSSGIKATLVGQK